MRTGHPTRALPYAFLLVTTTFACTPAQTSSRVQHDFGSTSRPRGAAVDCKTQPTSTASTTGDAYLIKIAGVLMAANPATFKDEYAADTFCFYVSHG